MMKYSYQEYFTIMDESIFSYTEGARRYEASTKNLNEDIFKLFSSFLPEGCSVLDAGCGPGRDLRRFKDSGFAPRGVDLNSTFVKMANEICLATQDDIMSLPFDSDHFDALWASASLVHMHYTIVEKALRELSRVVKPGGWSYISVKRSNQEASYEKLDRTPLGASYSYFWHGEHFPGLMEYCGFNVSEYWVENGLMHVFAQAR